jgi:hypothetical protein
MQTLMSQQLAIVPSGVVFEVEVGAAATARDLTDAIARRIRLSTTQHRVLADDTVLRDLAELRTTGIVFLSLLTLEEAAEHACGADR